MNKHMDIYDVYDVYDVVCIIKETIEENIQLKKACVNKNLNR